MHDNILSAFSAERTIANKILLLMPYTFHPYNAKANFRHHNSQFVFLSSLHNPQQIPRLRTRHLLAQNQKNELPVPWEPARYGSSFDLQEAVHNRLRQLLYYSLDHQFLDNTINIVVSKVLIC
ncbi:hypothetical protein [Mahella sp.]|uniref:hypothetical protein n=1 Tax=Mahella sp. TaxID=2798721 RepID=UPI0025C52F9E|nr:hypothetical protein [Mahella sp.]MBZ4664865.1 hypothetical protein [Mahella sp.]